MDNTTPPSSEPSDASPVPSVPVPLTFDHIETMGVTTSDDPIEDPWD